LVGTAALAASMLIVATASVGAAGAASCDSPGVSAKEIKIGALYPQTSEAFGSQFLPYGAGVRARLAYENDINGGVNGRKLVYSEADDKGDLTANFAAARQLVDSEGVFMVIEATPASKGPSAKYLNQKGVPVTGWPINYVWGVYKNMFGHGGSTVPQPDGGPTVSTGGAQFLKDHGATNVASIGIDVTESATAARGSADASKAVGMKVGYLKTDIPPTGTDFTADVAAMKEKGVDALWGSIQEPLYTQLYLKAKEAGIDFKVALSPTGYDQRIVDAFGKKIAGVYHVVDFAPFELQLPAHKTFEDAMAKYEPDAVPAKQQLSMNGWLAADLAIRGLKLAGKCPSREAFIKNLRKVKDYDAGGLLLRPVNEAKAFGKLATCLNYVQVSADGTKFELVDGAVPLCGKVVKRP
jgi:ABC-type branched-subunit amino acid transport system substrate-binding protein